MQKKRCAWVKQGDALYEVYHDTEWGKPLHDDWALFELLCLETQSAGLSWLTVLKKRESYRKAFANFELAKIRTFNASDVDRILQEGTVISYKAKIESILSNAHACHAIIGEWGSLDAYLWSFVDNQPIINDVPHSKMLPTTSPISDALTKDLKQRGFKFVGSTTLYAFMQACGMVNDHENDCTCK